MSKEKIENKKYNLLLSTVVCLTSAVFFLYEFILQVSPGVMTHEIMRDFNVDAVYLGIISAAYYVAYTVMQIPAGILYDKFGPRSLLSVASLICAIGALLFAGTHSIMAASVGRLLMGVGSSFAFIGCLVLVSRWYPARYFALLAGVVQLMSSIGALMGAAPVAAAIAVFGWRHTILALGYIGLVIMVIVWLLVRDEPDAIAHKQSHMFKSGELRRLAYVSSNPQTWLVALYAFTSWAPILVFAGLWGIPFIMQLYGISATKASSAVSMVWIGIGIGSPFVGWLSDKIRRRCTPLAFCSLLGLITIAIILYVPSIPFFLMFPLLLCFGLSASAQSLSFALVKDNNPPAIVGTAIGINNMMVVIGGVLFQPLVGLFLRLGWNGDMENSVPVYAIHDYRVALVVIPVCFLIGLIVSLRYLRESYCIGEQHDGQSHARESIAGCC
jgi:MFS family permease